MGANLDRLMKSYGVSTPTVSAYSGVAAPAALKADATAGEQGTYQGALTKYNAQKAAYDQYAGDYRNRINSTNLYSSPYMNILPDSQEVAQWNNTLRTPDYSGITGSMANLSDTTTVDPTVYTNPDYNSMINAAYGSLGRTGIGTSASNIDQPGYDYWMGQLRSGAISPNDFTNKFRIGANAYIAQNPNTDYTKYVQGYLGITPAVTTTAADTTTAAADTTAADTYSRSYDEDGNERYAHGGPVRHFYGGGINRIDGGMTDLANKYSLNNPADLPVIFAEAPTGTATDASASYPVSPARVAEMDASSRRTGGPGVTVAPVPVSAIGPAPAGAPAPVVAPPSADAAREALYEKYFKRGPESDEVKAARQNVADNRAALLKAINDQMGKSEENAPSKAEMYFRLAAALAAPTKTGGFMENVGLAAKELGEFQKSTTDAKKAAAAAKLQMLLKTNEITLQAAQEGLADLREGVKEDAANRRTIGMEIIKSEEKKNEAVTDAQKRAISLGFKKGTPQYDEYIAEDDAARKATAERAKTKDEQSLADARKAAEKREEDKKKLSTEQTKAKTKLNSEITTLDAALKKMDEAIYYAETAYTGSIGDQVTMSVRKNIPFAEKDPRVAATEGMIAALGSATLADAASMKGSLSDKDLAFLQTISGVKMTDPNVRAKTLLDARRKLEKALNERKNEFKEVSAGRWGLKTEPTED